MPINEAVFLTSSLKDGVDEGGQRATRFDKYQEAEHQQA